MSTLPRFLVIATAGLLSVLLATQFSLGQESDDAVSSEDGDSWALLIGVEKYHRASRLRHIVNDVEQIAAALLTRGTYDEERVLKIIDTVENPRFQPLRSSIMAELPQWLKKPGPRDTVVIYFSGHGFRDDEGNLYLAPLDCNPESPEETAIPVRWFREQIAACKAENKLLLIDSCHAGSEKSERDDDRVRAKQLGEPFEDLAGVVTIASSKGDELSQIWEERRQSLFSYWIVQALKGHADRDQDQVVDIDELYRYAHRRVTGTAKAQFPREQTPVRIVRTGTEAVPAVIRLRPQRLKQVIADMAEQLTLVIEQRNLERVGVLEFTSDTRIGELLGADYGLLGKYCAEELERSIVEYGEERFRVLDRRRLQAALKEQNFGLDDLASTDALGRLSEAADGLPVIALGTLRSRAGRVVHLQCKLILTSTNDVVGSAAGVAVLNESEWAMLGRSAQLTVEDRIPEPPAPGEPPPPVDEQLIARLDERALQRHPLADKNFDFPIRFMVDHGKGAAKRFVERKGIARGNDYYVPLSKGEVYRLWIENRSGEMALMRLLVDGVNTLPERRATPKGVEVVYVGHRTNLDDARYWALDPDEITGPKKEWGVNGFYTRIGNRGEYQQFLVTDARNSIAARTAFADQIGMITAAFYAPAGADTRSLGTTAGDTVQQATRESKGVKIGNLLSVVHIHYVEPEVFKKISRQP